MAQNTQPELLLRVSQAKKKLVDDWFEGISIPARTGRTLGEIRERAVADRFHLGVDFNRRGRRLMRSSPPAYRDAISRFYYSMYHVFRSVAYHSHGGDDFEQHKDLPSHLPQDFPNFSVWGNDLKSARDFRNAADYDMYPKTNAPWRANAEVLEALAASAINEARLYLGGKGVRL